MSPLEWLVAFLLGSLVVAIVALAAHAARSALEVGLVAVVGLAVAFVLFVPDENGVRRSTCVSACTMMV